MKRNKIDIKYLECAEPITPGSILEIEGNGSDIVIRMRTPLSTKENAGQVLQDISRLMQAVLFAMDAPERTQKRLEVPIAISKEGFIN